MFSEFLLVGVTAIANAALSSTPAGQNVSLSEAANLLKNNLIAFSSAIRAAWPGAGNFHPRSIENEVWFSDSKKTETFFYLDFEGNQGYVVLAENLDMPLFVPTGQLVFPQGRPIYYDRELGFVGEDSLENLLPLDCANSMNPQKTGTYNGQENGAEGCGKIIDPVAYVSARYGSGWTSTLNSTPLWSSFPQQTNFSFYQRYEDNGSITSEGNCLLASIYEALDYFRYSGTLPTLPSGYVPSYPENDPFYSLFMSQTTASGSPRYVTTNSTVPSLHRTVRNWFRDNDSYSFVSASVNHGPNFIAFLNDLFGFSLTSQVLTSWSFDNDIFASISAHQRLYIWNEDEGTYAAHSMPVCGASRFSKTTGWWIFSHTDYLNFLRVADNLVTSPRFVDLSAYQSEFPNTGSFLEIKFQ